MIEKYWLELIFGLISAGTLAFCKYLLSQINDYKKLLEKRENEVVEKTIEEKLAPIQEEIEKLKLLIDQVATQERYDVNKIVASWGYRINQLCNIYLEEGYMTNLQYMQLVEMYNLYHDLGGNGRIKEIFERTTQTLQIHSDK